MGFIEGFLNSQWFMAIFIIGLIWFSVKILKGG